MKRLFNIIYMLYQSVNSRRDRSILKSRSCMIIVSNFIIPFGSEICNILTGVARNSSLIVQLSRYTILGFGLVEYAFSFVLMVVFCTILFFSGYPELSKNLLLSWDFRFIYYRDFFDNYFIFMNKMDKLFYSSFTRKIFFSFILCSLGLIIYNFFPFLFPYWRLLCIMFTVLMIIHKCNYKPLPSIISIIIYLLIMLTFQYLTYYLINNVDNIVMLLKKLVINTQDLRQVFLSLLNKLSNNIHILSQVFLSLSDKLSNNIHISSQVFLPWLKENIACYDFLSKKNKQNIAEFIVNLIHSNNWNLITIDGDNYETTNDLLDINNVDFIINKMDNQGSSSKRPRSPSPITDAVYENLKSKKSRSAILDNVNEIHKSKGLNLASYLTSTNNDEPVNQRDPHVDKLEQELGSYIDKFQEERNKLDKLIKFNSNESDRKCWDFIYSYLERRERMNLRIWGNILVKAGVPVKDVVEMSRYAMENPPFYPQFFNQDGSIILNPYISRKFLTAFFCEYYDSEFKQKFYNDPNMIPQNRLESSFVFLEIFKLKSYNIQNIDDLFYGINPHVKQAILKDFVLETRGHSLEYPTRTAIKIARQIIMDEYNTK